MRVTFALAPDHYFLPGLIFPVGYSILGFPTNEHTTMQDLTFNYPATPVEVPANITEPSPAFKKEVVKSISSVVLFLFVYLLMLLVSVGLVIGCTYAGIMLIVNVPKLMMILVGLGLISVGILVLIFLVKFLFAVSRHDNSGNIEITEKDQPKLFAFIRQLTKDTQTPFPKRIFLSPEVNACVFYNSSFWSMFLPIRKNLQIGLALVNIVNVSEFKAVMAHEFGHFSQRSMKVGSFVYNVNRIIHNMLFENSSYQRFLQDWANIHGVFAFFAMIAANLAKGIQWVLRQMYGVINKSYMKLSREMEFHADAVAASVSGSESLVTALRRLEIGNTSYNFTLQKCDELLTHNKVSENVYYNHRIVLHHLASEYDLEIKHDLPVISNSFIDNNNLSRINYKDQWASHPSTDDRENHLNSLGVRAEIDNTSAWNLFENTAELQAEMTRKIYEKAIEGKEILSINNTEFDNFYRAEVEKYSFLEIYNGYFDGRLVKVPDSASGTTGSTSASHIAEHIFTNENASLYKKITALDQDIAVLNAIASKQISTKTFDFDGNKFPAVQAPEIIAKLEAEKTALQKKLDDTDLAVWSFFSTQARTRGQFESLSVLFNQYFEVRENADEYLKLINDMFDSLGPVLRGETIQIEDVNNMINNLKADHEIKFKGWLRKWQSKGAFSHDDQFTEKVNDFLSKDYTYFSNQSFFDSELNDLLDISRKSWEYVNEFQFNKFKTILELRLGFN